MKNKKITIDITILHQCTKNYDKMFGCTVTAWDKEGQRRTKKEVFLGQFLHFLH